MNVENQSPTLPDARRFLGRDAKPCRKCGGVSHYVNRIGGISCERCTPPRPGYCLLRMTIVGGTWDDADDPFGKPDNPKNSGFSKNAPRSHSSPSAASVDEAGASSQTSASIVVRRNAANEYAEEELNWAVCPGGILDQMKSGPRTASRLPSPCCHRGETVDDIRERLAGHATRSARRQSDHGTVAAELTEDLRFVIGSEIDRHGVNRLQVKVYPAGEPCLLFVGRKVPPRDPEAEWVNSSLASRKDDAKNMAVVRLDGRIRLIKINQVKTI